MGFERYCSLPSCCQFNHPRSAPQMKNIHSGQCLANDKIQV
jgi:hypothetical protein